MPRIWSGLQDVDRAVEVITQTVHDTGTLPDPIVQAYTHSLESASPELVQRFSQRLAAQCPAALVYFAA
ncbi:MAG: hypothetical protein HY689_06230 [Chloroflexi bacterium]|nr:hypothetical protein [Chloroflexota bacterium]